MAADHTKLRGVESIDDALLSEQLEANVISWLQWGLLNIGNFYNVTIPQSGAYGGQTHRLRPVKDPNYNDGQVWEGFRQDWVWESGVEYPRRSSINVSGVYVNGAFKPLSGTGTYAHHVNFPLGRVVFDSAISTTSAVTCEYSFRHYHLYPSSSPWWRQVQENSYRVDDPTFLQAGSGNWSILSQNRVQLPAAVVQVVPRTSRRPLQIGDGSAIVSQEVSFHILAETDADCRFLHDVLTHQWQKRLIAFDLNRLSRNDRLPLTADGSPHPSGALMYPDLVKPSGQGGYGWRQLRITDTRSVEYPQMLPLVACGVKATVEVDLP